MLSILLLLAAIVMCAYGADTTMSFIYETRPWREIPRLISGLAGIGGGILILEMLVVR